MSDEKHDDASERDNPRGIYERPEGSGIWYVRYRDERFVVLSAPLPDPLPASRGEGTGAATSRP